jgi:type 1 glutamine amidotransferase
LGESPVFSTPKLRSGRVFYGSLGHGSPVFWNAALLEHFLAGSTNASIVVFIRGK